MLEIRPLGDLVRIILHYYTYILKTNKIQKKKYWPSIPKQYTKKIKILDQNKNYKLWQFFFFNKSGKT